jgi:hypothetical protein
VATARVAACSYSSIVVDFLVDLLLDPIAELVAYLVDVTFARDGNDDRTPHGTTNAGRPN